MRKATRGVIVASAVTALAATAVAVTPAHASPDRPLDYQAQVIAPLVLGAASNQTADVIRDERPELIVSVYDEYTVVGGEAVLQPGSLYIYTNRSKKHLGASAAKKETLENWERITVFGPEENIVFPSQVQVADVDGDGDQDLLHGGGFFWDSNLGINRGTITWWENDHPNGKKWIRHSVRTESPGSYHNLDYKDLDGDGIKDIVTVAEQGMTRQSFADDIVELEFYKGLGGGAFADRVVLANGGGSSPKVHDVDGDGDMDVISAQYFNVNPIVLGPPSGEGSFVWFENTDTDGTLTPSDFVEHEISRGQGPSYAIYPVPNLFGDGVLRYVGANHTNNTPGTPGPPAFLQAAPNVFLLTPGADIRAPWTVEVLADSVDPGAAFAATARAGQAAPGKSIFRDLDGDGDLDIATGGDGDFRAFIHEQTAPGVFHQSVLEGSEGWGQAGISVADFNLDGKLEIALSAFENNKVGIWKLTD